jgi:hypothetical protein
LNYCDFDMPKSYRKNGLTQLNIPERTSPVLKNPTIRDDNTGVRSVALEAADVVGGGIGMNKLRLISAVMMSVAISVHAFAQNLGASPLSSSELAPSLRYDSETLLPGRSGTFGLKPNAAGAKEGIALPFGMNYSSESKSLVMPLGEKSDWGVGLNLNVNSSARAIESAPSSALGLQPKRTPGLTLQRKF